MQSNNVKFAAKPFLKWVGGKTQLLNDIKQNLPKDLEDIDTYIEPFIGGGAALFDIVPMLPNVKHVIINDLNHKLTNVYFVIKYCHTELIKELMELEKKYWASSSAKLSVLTGSGYEIQKSDKERMFYNIRTSFNYYKCDYPSDYTKHAAEFIFLNKTCFNGLYRENAKGEFNTPWNKSAKPLICDTDNINAVHEFLVKYDVKIMNGPYFDTFRELNPIRGHCKALIYMDPPYRPLTKTAAFTAYTKSGFNDDDQKKLKEYCDALSSRNHYIIVSNSDPKNTDENDNFFDELYKNYNIVRVNAKRNINSKGDGRGSITEILVKNF